MIQTRPPNILLLLPDQHRYDWLGFLGAVPVRTPNIDRLAAEGKTFTHTYCPSPLCGPSRACLATGRAYIDCGVPDHQHNLPDDAVTYYQRLRQSGYHVLSAGKLDLAKADEDWGTDGSLHLEQWGFTAGVNSEGKRDAVRGGATSPKGPYMAYLKSRGLAQAHVDDFAQRQSYADTFPTPLPDDDYSDNWIGAKGLELLRDVPFGEPWHLVVNFTGPHEPMDVTTTMRERWEGVSFPDPIDAEPGDHQQIRRNYAAMIENIDSWVGRYLQALDERGELENTVVIYASDHGEMLGDHGLWGKQTFHEASVRVPLIIRGPERWQGRSDALVCLQDLTATILDLSGSEPLPGADGRSLRPLLEGTGEWHRKVAVSALESWAMATDGTTKLVATAGAGRACYAIRQHAGATMDEKPTNASDCAERLAAALPRPWRA